MTAAFSASPLSLAGYGSADAPAARRPRVAPVLLFAVLFGAVPLLANDYLFSAILVPLLVFSLAALGLNLLTGYTGQLSLGSAAFMAIGAFATYNLALRLPQLPLLVSIALGGGISAAVGVLFGLPSLRIKGFYLIVSTLAAQFFVQWVFVKVDWFSNHSASGVISAPKLVVAGVSFDSPAGRYLFTLGIVAALTWFARNLVGSATGRQWRAVRDRETAAEAMGIAVLRAKLTAFAASAFYLGVAGALWAFAYLGTVEPHGFDLDRSFQILFIAIIGGLGSIAGNFLGAAFLVLFPVLMSQVVSLALGGAVDGGTLQNLQKVVFGALIIVFLVKEPDGLARLVQRARDRCRAWPLRA